MKRDLKWVMPRKITITDPRIAIAKHIGWTRPLSTITDYSLPEPDNYNYAVLNALPWDCPVIEDQVFYQDKKSSSWWTVYYVPDEKLQEFLAWADPLPFEQCWAVPRRPSKMRTQRTLLHTRAQAVEQTAEERLFTMGYYDSLQTKFEIDIGTTLGKPRDNMPQGEFT